MSNQDTRQKPLSPAVQRLKEASRPTLVRDLSREILRTPSRPKKVTDVGKLHTRRIGAKKRLKDFDKLLKSVRRLKVEYFMKYGGGASRNSHPPTDVELFSLSTFSNVRSLSPPPSALDMRQLKFHRSQSAPKKRPQVSVSPPTKAKSFQRSKYSPPAHPEADSSVPWFKLSPKHQLQALSGHPTIGVEAVAESEEEEEELKLLEDVKKYSKSGSLNVDESVIVESGSYSYLEGMDEGEEENVGEVVDESYRNEEEDKTEQRQVEAAVEREVGEQEAAVGKENKPATESEKRSSNKGESLMDYIDEFTKTKEDEGDTKFFKRSARKMLGNGTKSQEQMNGTVDSTHSIEDWLYSSSPASSLDSLTAPIHSVNRTRTQFKRKTQSIRNKVRK